MTVFLPRNVVRNVERLVSPMGMLSSSRTNSWNPTKLYFSVFNVWSAKSFEVVSFVNWACETFKFAVNMLLLMLFLITTAVDGGTFEVKLSFVKTSQSFAANRVKSVVS